MIKIINYFEIIMISCAKLLNFYHIAAGFCYIYILKCFIYPIKIGFITYYYLFHHLPSEDGAVLAVGVGSADVGSIGCARAGIKTYHTLGVERHKHTLGA